MDDPGKSLGRADEATRDVGGAGPRALSRRPLGGGLRVDGGWRGRVERPRRPGNDDLRACEQGPGDRPAVYRAAPDGPGRTRWTWPHSMDRATPDVPGRARCTGPHPVDRAAPAAARLEQRERMGLFPESP